MDETVYALLRLGDGADARMKRLSRRLQRIAVYAFGNTYGQLNAMLGILEEKRMLENALYYRENLLKGLTDEERRLLFCRAYGISSEKLTGEMGYSSRSVRRKTKEAVRAAENILFLLGCDGKSAQECEKVCCIQSGAELSA